LSPVLFSFLLCVSGCVGSEETVIVSKISDIRATVSVSAVSMTSIVSDSSSVIPNSAWLMIAVGEGSAVSRFPLFKFESTPGISERSRPSGLLGGSHGL
jgi:hypothetical protein